MSTAGTVLLRRGRSARYAYRAFNIVKKGKIWAVTDAELCEYPCRTLEAGKQMINRWYKRGQTS